MSPARMTAFPLRPDQHRRGQAPAGAPTNNLEGKQRPLAVVFALCSLLVVSATGQSADTLFSRANDLYRAGAFAQAAQQYEAILSQGSVSGEVQFNLGNCYYREGGVGRAILAFERAQRLMPSDDDVAHNLHLAPVKVPLEPPAARVVADVVPLVLVAGLCVPRGPLPWPKRCDHPLVKDRFLRHDPAGPGVRNHVRRSGHGVA